MAFCVRGLKDEVLIIEGWTLAKKKVLYCLSLTVLPYYSTQNYYRSPLSGYIGCPPNVNKRYYHKKPKKPHQLSLDLFATNFTQKTPLAINRGSHHIGASPPRHSSNQPLRANPLARTSSHASRHRHHAHPPHRDDR